MPVLPKSNLKVVDVTVYGLIGSEKSTTIGVVTGTPVLLFAGPRYIIVGGAVAIVVKE